MVRIQVPAVVAAAALALAACSSLNGYAPSAGGGATFDPVLFPPPPPVPPEPRGVAANRDRRDEIAGLTATVERLSADVQANRRRLAALSAELQRTRARIEALLAADAPAAAASPALPGEEPGGNRRPLVRIRHDRPSEDHADAVRTAVGAALARLPDAVFDLVAVTAGGDGTTADAGAADEAWTHAEEVMADLLEMGLAADRLTLSAAAGGAADVGEVRIYVR